MSLTHALTDQFCPSDQDRHTPGFNIALQYLEERGVDEKLRTKLGIRIQPLTDVYRLHYGGTPSPSEELAIVFPYFNPFHPESSAYWTVRKLQPGVRPVGGFGALTLPVPTNKVTAPKGSAPEVYFPPNLKWAKLPKGATVYICESVLKAITVARLGYWAIGLNGSRGFSSRAAGVRLLPGFSDLLWTRMQLRPVILFDSDTATNGNVEGARVELAARLAERYDRLVTYQLDLPHSPEGEKWGIDDYCMRHGDVATREFLSGEPEETEITEAAQLLAEFNNKYAVVMDQSKIVDVDAGVVMSRAQFTDVYCADKKLWTDDDPPRAMPYSKMWIADDRRRTTLRIDYVPGAERITPEFYNVWTPMLEPEQGDVGPWLELMALAVPAPALRTWVVQWFAYIVQNVGGKNYTYLHLYGPNGSGKNSIIAPILQIFAKNGISLGKERVQSDFNSVYVQKQFLNINEISGGNDAGAVALNNKIKVLVTEPKLTVNAKGQQEYEVTNYVNLVTTANDSDAIKLDEDDRRAVVMRVDVCWGPEEWDAYYAWIDGGGAAALHAHLLGVSLEGFNSKAKAPMTEEKGMVVEATRGSLEQWIWDLKHEPEIALQLMYGYTVLDNQQLALAAYAPATPERISPSMKTRLTRKMKDAGYKQVSVKVTGAVMRVWVLAPEGSKWLPARIVKEYLKTPGRPKNS